METELDTEIAKSLVLNWTSIPHTHTQRLACTHKVNTPIFSSKSSDGEY